MTGLGRVVDGAMAVWHSTRVSPALRAARIRRGSHALGWRLAVVGVALGLLLTAAVGRNGCLRHGFGVIDVPVAAASVETAPEHAELGHAACPACAASSIGAGVVALATTDLDAPITAARLDLPDQQAPPTRDAPLDYAPKTSPPRG